MSANAFCAVATLYWVLSTAACATESTSDEKPAESVEAVFIDASTASEPLPRAITTVPPTGTHLDGDATGYQPRVYEPRQTKGKTVELLLRSSPSGATASIDGVAIGVTPTIWVGKSDHQAHEFTFVKVGHSMARYRFVATHSGVVHGSLAPLQRADEIKKSKDDTQ